MQRDRITLFHYFPIIFSLLEVTRRQSHLKSLCLMNCFEGYLEQNSEKMIKYAIHKPFATLESLEITCQDVPLLLPYLYLKITEQNNLNHLGHLLRDAVTSGKLYHLETLLVSCTSAISSDIFADIFILLDGRVNLKSFTYISSCPNPSEESEMSLDNITENLFPNPNLVSLKIRCNMSDAALISLSRFISKCNSLETCEVETKILHEGGEYLWDLADTLRVTTFGLFGMVVGTESLCVKGFRFSNLGLATFIELREFEAGDVRALCYGNLADLAVECRWLKHLSFYVYAFGEAELEFLEEVESRRAEKGMTMLDFDLESLDFKRVWRHRKRITFRTRLVNDFTKYLLKTFKGGYPPYKTETFKAHPSPHPHPTFFIYIV
ncbi:hypothetical protein BC829DRAFT_392707 [Chytridium lagenaria]|nr:hypothetical protein BC829DRAFT_392707 [Chytridium lagenaria]